MKKERKYYKDNNIFTLTADTNYKTTNEINDDVLLKTLGARYGKEIDRWSDFSKFVKGVAFLEIFDVISNMKALASKDPTLNEMMFDDINCNDLSWDIVDTIKSKLFSTDN